MILSTMDIVLAPKSLATLAVLIMSIIGYAATFTPASFAKKWLKRGVDVKEGTPSYFFTVGGIGAGSLAIAVTSFLSLLKNGDLPGQQVIPVELVSHVTTSKAIAYGTFTLLLVYVRMWYAGNMAYRMRAYKISTDVAFLLSFFVASYALLAPRNDLDSEQTALSIIRGFSKVLVPWSLAHYIYPDLLKITFNLNITEGEKILNCSACAFFVAHGVLQGALAHGIEPTRAIAYMALVMFLSSLDFQRLNPRWGLKRLPKEVEIDWSRVNGVIIWSGISFGILYGLHRSFQ